MYVTLLDQHQFGTAIQMLEYKMLENKMLEYMLRTFVFFRVGTGSAISQTLLEPSLGFLLTPR